MYLDHFGLRDYPFSTSPDPRFYYPSAKHREALACLIYAVEQRKGFALISGEVGAGKTMLCRAALQRLGDRVESAMLCHTSITPTQFLKAIAAEFGLNPWGKNKIQVINTLRAFLTDRRKQGQTVVLIIDEAQALSAEVLEEVRLLGNLETDTEKLVQTVLVGQPELRQLVGQHRLRQLDQRIAVKFHLGALSEDDVGAYMDHRLHVAGSDGRIVFSLEAKAEVGRASGGLPRLVNSLCDQALLQAFVSDEPGVSVETVRRVIAEREGYYMDMPKLVLTAEALATPAMMGGRRRARHACPECGVRLAIFEDDAGKSGLCPGCGISLKVPVNIFGTGPRGPVPAAQGPAEQPLAGEPAAAQGSSHKTGED